MRGTPASTARTADGWCVAAAPRGRGQRGPRWPGPRCAAATRAPRAPPAAPTGRTALAATGAGTETGGALELRRGLRRRRRRAVPREAAADAGWRPAAR
eukprot:scaffold23445_cov129-Isochrysis_galbana.AAC.1